MKKSNLVFMFHIRFYPILAVLLLAFLVTQCEIIRDLTTEPGTTTTSPKTEDSKRPDSKEMRLRQDIVTYAEKYKGTKYTYAGKVPSTGFDCSGFTSYVMKEFDVTLSPSSREQAKQGTSKRLEDLQPGDLVFYRRGSDQPIFHVSMVVKKEKDKLYVIHATNRGVVVDDVLNNSYWKQYIYMARDVIR